MARWSAADLARVSSNLREHIPNPIPNSKYGNQITNADGYTFDSKLEAKRYGELKLLLLSGAIHDLKVHKRWHLHVNNIEIGYYEADFTYQEGNQTVIEDVKGMRTPMYRWKKRHVLAEYGIEIREITA